MSSGFGLNGGRNRCFTFFQEFMKCYAQADNREECRLQFEDYQECLYHRKELARLEIVQEHYLKKKAAEKHNKTGTTIAAQG
ncbi:hypothetical protein BJ742DRAFT_756250 [Cladochytrium replicatum]|nr:hypothetical protein BJ742DRAFT_756250 [Cladochytrium replicatum]